jgi:hypothetical protein
MSSLVDSASLGGGGGGGGGGMAGGGGGGGGGGSREELKTQFMTREGLYKLMTLSEYSRPNRVGYANTAANPGAPVRVSFALATTGNGGVKAAAGGVTNGSVGSATGSSSSADDQNKNCDSGSALSSSPSAVWTGEKITFNYGREIFVYPYKGVRKAADLTKPIDKRIYKGTSPTCHDFGAVVSNGNENSDVVIPLLVGFTGGQIQLVDPVRKELSKLFNEEVREKHFKVCA